MKKLTFLFTMLLLASWAKAEEFTVTYALAEGDTFTSGQTVDVANGEETVATITYGESGGASFKAAKADNHVDDFTAYTEGNGVNGDKAGGTFYTIVPKYDGTIDVAVVLNADKGFYVLENGTAMSGYNGITVNEKYYGTYSFDVTAGKSYKFYCAGSKLGFYGFNYTYSVGGPTVSVPVFSPEDGTVFAESLDVTLTADDGLDIYYSDNESNVKTSGTLYDGPITISETTTLYAASQNADGVWSKVVSATYILEGSEDVLVPVSPTYIYNFSDFDEKIYSVSTDEVIENNLGILASSKEIKINGSNKTYDGVSYTRRLQFNGAGNTAGQHVHFKVSGACMVTVIGVSGNSDDVRSLAVSIAGEETAGDMTGDLNTVSAIYTGEEVADVYVYSKKSGINIYAIKVEPVPAAQTVDITLNKYGLGTFFYAQTPFVLPEGLNAATYTLQRDNSGKAKLVPSVIYESGSFIPSCEPVVLKGEANMTYTLTESPEDGDVDNNSFLYGSEQGGSVEDPTANYVYYMLSAKNGVVGFYYGAPDGAAFEIDAHKAYLKIEKDMAANIVGFDLGNLTAIESVTAVDPVNADATVYNLNGQKVNGSYKGVVIVNGKKEIRK